MGSLLRARLLMRRRVGGGEARRLWLRGAVGGGWVALVIFLIILGLSWFLLWPILNGWQLSLPGVGSIPIGALVFIGVIIIAATRLLGRR